MNWSLSSRPVFPKCPLILFSPSSPPWGAPVIHICDLASGPHALWGATFASPVFISQPLDLGRLDLHTSTPHHPAPDVVSTTQVWLASRFSGLGQWWMSCGWTWASERQSSPGWLLIWVSELIVYLPGAAGGHLSLAGNPDYTAWAPRSNHAWSRRCFQRPRNKYLFSFFLVKLVWRRL